jgi:RND family efflux transporter MFP subunit
MRSTIPSVPALLALVLGACSRGDAPRATRPAPLVGVARVEVREVPVEVHAPVDLKPLLVADVGAKTLGYLDAVLVDRGDLVKAGQLLATVRPSDLPDQLEAERAALEQFKAGAALARSNFERAQRLAPSGLVSDQELQQATTNLAAAESAQAASRSRIEALAVRLGEMRIVSPLEGVVLNRRLDPGALVGPGGSGGVVLTVARTDVLRVFVSINEREAPRVQLGQLAHVELDAYPGRTFEGKVMRLSPAFDTATRTLDAEVQLANPRGELRIGMYGRASIVLEVHPGSIVAPATAVVINSLGRYGFVLEGDKVHRRTFETGVDGGNWLEVTSGLKAGEEVVVAGADGLADGMTVRASRASEPPPKKPEVVGQRDGATDASHAN